MDRGWMDRQMDGKLDGWTDGQMDGLLNCWMVGQIHGQKHRRIKQSINQPTIPTNQTNQKNNQPTKQPTDKLTPRVVCSTRLKETKLAMPFASLYI